MEEEDHDDLLQYTDDESLSESDDQCIPADKEEENQQSDQNYVRHTKLEFVVIKILLIVSSTFLVILLPLYLETVNVKSDSYNMIFATTMFTTLILLLTMFAMKYFCPELRNKSIMKPPISWSRIAQVSCMLTLSGFMIVYAVDRKRVMCHLQDPIKGIILVFSLLYYFFFCKKLMGLQRIFSTTTIIVGLFISVDYGLCDEFKCRGREREHRSDDAGRWVWQAHTIWTSVYVVGIGLFAAYITILDRFLLINKEESDTSTPTTLLSTVSRRVSFPNSNYSLNNMLLSQRTATDELQMSKSYTTVHLGLCIHLIGFLIVLILFWTDLIPYIGKGNNMTEFLNFTNNGLSCQFSFTSSKCSSCGYMALYSWLFLLSYLLFTFTMLRFLILTQSAVYTVATIATSLPIVGIFWSLFNMTTDLHDLVTWSPSVTGELICAMLGLPVIVTGLCLLCKSHFKDYHMPKRHTSQINASP